MISANKYLTLPTIVPSRRHPTARPPRGPGRRRSPRRCVATPGTAPSLSSIRLPLPGSLLPRGSRCEVAVERDGRCTRCESPSAAAVCLPSDEVKWRVGNALLHATSQQTNPWKWKASARDLGVCMVLEGEGVTKGSREMHRMVFDSTAPPRRSHGAEWEGVAGSSLSTRPSFARICSRNRGASSTHSMQGGLNGRISTLPFHYQSAHFRPGRYLSSSHNLD
jgi:hypothetical protein